MALTSARQILNKKILGGGSSADVQELKVEVAALSASVLSIGEKVENITEYSDEEVVIGKWFDKTLYKKTIHIADGLTISQDAWGNVGTLDEQIFIVKCEGVQDTGTETSFYNLGANCDTSKALTVWNYRSQSTTVHYITIYYYKTEVTESKKKTTKKK